MNTIEPKIRRAGLLVDEEKRYDQIRVLRDRYATIANELKYWSQCAVVNRDMCPVYVAKGTIHVMELADLIRNTNILPAAPVIANILKWYSELVKRQMGA